MKKTWCIVLACVMALACPLTASATVMTQVTDYGYTSMRTGGIDGTIVYTAYNDDGSYAIGTLTAEGEQTRELHTFDGWNALFADPVWKTTYHGDGSPLCPYVHTHGDNTVCPYMALSCVTLTNTQTGVTLENVYTVSDASQLLPEGSVHFCWGRYGYKAADTLRWDGESRYMALKNDSGLWGVFDAETDRLVVEHQYADAEAVYGDYVKVFNGEQWARLDLSGGFVPRFCYATAEEFSVRDEVRMLSDGQWQLFNKDNEAISPVITAHFNEAVYYPTAGVLLAENTDKTKTMYDIEGAVLAQFAATDEVTWLQDTCFAVEQYTESGALSGAALYRADDVTTPADLVKKGDVNFDGSVNSIDARLALRCVVAKGALTARQTAAADMNDSDTVDSADVRAILQAATA